MSDPVTNHDIEDVLSSIRRLVAQGDSRRVEESSNAPTPFHKSVPIAPRVDETPEKEAVLAEEKPVDRLVLTPAFRVAPQAEAPAVEEVAEAPMVEDAPQAVEPVAPFDAALRKPESDAIPTKDERPIPAAGQSPSERASLEATIAELEAAVNSRTDDWEPDGSEVPPAPDFQSIFANKLDAIRPSRFLRRQAKEDALSTASEESAADLEFDEEATTETALNAIVVDHIAEAVQGEIADAFPHLMAADEAPDDATDLHATALAGASADLAQEQIEIDRDQVLADAQEETPATNGASHTAFEDDTVVRLTPETTPPVDVPETPQVMAEPTPLTIVPDVPVEMEEVAAELSPSEPDAEAVVADAPAAVAEMAPSMAEPVEPIAPEVVETEGAAPEAETPTFRHAQRFAEVYDPVAEATADAAEAAPDAGDIYGDELTPDPEETGTAVATPAAPGQLMDPDMVRDMVSQMIRAELQGEMGERITRNVRKLVRREINRVLSAQEFE